MPEVITDADTECPRCGSTDVDDDVETDIPVDERHDHGCNDCLFVWDER